MRPVWLKLKLKKQTAEPLARREATIPEVEATEEGQNVVVARASA